ncbi:MAG: histidine triad nucleotide-binding protein [Clostridiales bacterium]|nr:histidine triad nucleotide-binding protein [Clostridiales bacterium]
MKNNCVFCAIEAGEIPSEKLYEDERMIVIKDIEPRAPLHYLAIPKRHYKLLSEMTDADREDLGKIFAVIPTLAPKLGLQGGYRLVINQGDDAGQTVFHLHIHILGGHAMDFPEV